MSKLSKKFPVHHTSSGSRSSTFKDVNRKKEEATKIPLSQSSSARPQTAPGIRSIMFMRDRHNSIEDRQRKSQKKRKSEQQERMLQDDRRNPKPTYTYQAPKVVPGDIAELFGAESIQNREVYPGDFVEVRLQGKAVYGIYVQNFDQSEGRFQTTSITLGDQIIGHRTADVVFRIPGYLFMERVKAVVGEWDVDANPASPPVGSGKAAAEFADEAMVLVGTFYTKFSTVYNTFWHDRKRTMVTTPEVARFVFGKEDSNSAPLTLQELYATHLFLTQDVNLVKFVPSVAVRWTGEFAMRPPKDVLLTETVIDWMRKGDPRIQQFVQKAKVLIEGHRQGDKSGWNDVTFTDSDRALIEFVKETAINGYSDVFIQPHLTYLPKILRPMDMYGDIEAGSAFRFLNEIGVWSNWHNMEVKRSGIPLAKGRDEEQAILSRMLVQDPTCLQQEDAESLGGSSQKTLMQDDAAISRRRKSTGKSEQSNFNPMVLQDPTELYKQDPCDPIRHDFGQQPVYAIDDPSASELDDAFSIEPVPITTLTPEPSTWIHVHVADPTSILPPFHEMSRLAAERIQTVYLPERTWPMLPRSLTEGALSLKNDGTPKKVMTFSARISDASGDILDFKIRPGLVHTIVTLNYDDVDEVLSWDRIQGGEDEGARVRNSVMSSPEERSIEREYYRATKGSVNTEDRALVKHLRELQSVSQRHQDYRLRNGAFNFSLGRPVIDITPYPLPPIVEDGLAPVDYSHWKQPHISCRLDPTFASPARLMVAEYMMVAGRVAALFSRDHHLPTMFRNQSPPAEKYRASFEEIIRDKTDLKTGMLSIFDMLQLKPYIPGAEISTVPLGHWSMGVREGYCKVTSPLRRYSDMLIHWQLKGILLSQHQSTSASTLSRPVFGLDELVRLSGVIRDRERMLGMLEARSVRFWLSEMLLRREKAGLSNIFDGLVLNPTGDGYNVMSTLLGFQSVVKADPEETGVIEIGSRVRYEVDNINPQRPYLGAKHIARL
ncbi:hypothetical protein BGX34_010528 [Mortierella sp. NVP85]|nr:hypothetical protein BGX34_010528 [Mortierella sp. NVP85]